MNEPRSIQSSNGISVNAVSANARFLQMALDRLRLLLRRRVLWLRSQWQHDPLEESDKGVVSDAHVAWLLRTDDHAAEGAFYAQNPKARELTAVAASVRTGMDDIRRQVGQTNALPLDVLAHLFGLDDIAQDVLLLCLAPELDPAFLSLYAYVQDNVKLAYPTMHLAYALFGLPGAPLPALQQTFSADAPLRRYQLVTLQTQQQPLGSQPLSLPERILDYLRSTNRPDARVAHMLLPVQDAFLTEALTKAVDQVLQSVQTARVGGQFPVINLIGTVDGGQREVAAATAAALRIHLFELDPARVVESWPSPLEFVGLLEREALLLQCAYYIDLARQVEVPLPVRRLIQTMEQQANILLLVGHRDRLEAGSRLTNVTLPRLASHDRQVLWQQALGTQGSLVDITQIVQQFQFGPQGVRQTVSAARHTAAMHGRTDALTRQDLWDACRQQAQRQLDDLAQRIEPAHEWEDLVLPPDSEAQLHEIAAQVRHRHRVYDAWGYERKLNRGRGISALFAGPSGTGKTMAAEVLANELNLPLHRIDLAGIVSKYVGETEKNLRRIFGAAEQSGTILFFDEADALFGKRTDVKDSHDRYANIEVNYLLQLMENYTGLAILATNRRQAIDRAFLRRLRFVVDFAFPNMDNRRRIWQQVFPSGVPLARLDYNQLARLEITGGNIHSIALNAAFLAAADGGVVEMAHLWSATRREYAKLEKLVPNGVFGAV